VSLARAGCATLGSGSKCGGALLPPGARTRPTEGFKMLQALFNLILGGFGATGAAITDVVNWED